MAALFDEAVAQHVHMHKHIYDTLPLLLSDRNKIQKIYTVVMETH